MSTFPSVLRQAAGLGVVAALLALFGWFLPMLRVASGDAGAAVPVPTWTGDIARGLVIVAGLAAAAINAGRGGRPPQTGMSVLRVGSLFGALFAAVFLAAGAPARGLATPGPGFWLTLVALVLLAVDSVRRLAERDGRLFGIGAAVLFGVWILYFWQVLVAAFAIPRVLLPTPWLIAQSLAAGAPILSGDFVQTVLKSVLTGWVLGCSAGFLVGIAIDRVPFLQRGLLPVAALTSAIPLVGVAPIAVMWFGFDWPSKAAVVVLMTFFPMLIATLAGLQAASRQQLELMHSYAAGYLRTLLDLRLPTALPFLFGALKVNAALALIGAIVAEFFGSPTSGLGFRISTEAAHMNMALVWAAIVVAAATGSVTYTLLSQLERRVAFWHPSMRES